MYPTAVVTTPGSVQKMRSAPQKQPIATYRTCVPSGQGPSIDVPSTSWRSRMSGRGELRPARASSAVIRVRFVDPNTAQVSHDLGGSGFAGREDDRYFQPEVGKARHGAGRRTASGSDAARRCPQGRRLDLSLIHI